MNSVMFIARDGGRRRIDYGLCSSVLKPKWRRQITGVQEHHMVAYGIALGEREPDCVTPSFVKLGDDVIKDEVFRDDDVR